MPFKSISLQISIHGDVGLSSTIHFSFITNINFVDFIVKLRADGASNSRETIFFLYSPRTHNVGYHPVPAKTPSIIRKFFV